MEHEGKREVCHSQTVLEESTMKCWRKYHHASLRDSKEVWRNAHPMRAWQNEIPHDIASRKEVEVLPRWSPCSEFWTLKLEVSLWSLSLNSTSARSHYGTSSHVQLEVDGPQWVGTFPTEVVHEVSSTSIEVRRSKTLSSSRSSLKWKRSVSKMKFANEGARFSTKNEVEVHQICQENWHPVWISKTKHAVSSKSVSLWQWSDEKQNEVRGSRPLNWNTAVSASTFLKFDPEVNFLKFSSDNEVAKPQPNKTKRSEVYHGYLPEMFFQQLRGVLWKIHAYIRVSMKCETTFYTGAVRSQTTLPEGYVTPSDMRCLWHTSFVMYFVIISDGFEVPATFLTETTPEATSSWMKRNRSWTCFVFLEVPNLVAIDLPVVLSVWIRMFTFLESWDSKRSDLVTKLSHTPSMAQSSASPLERATVACVRLWEVIKVPRKYKAIPEVLSLEVAQPAHGVHIGVDVKSRLLGMRNDLRSKCQNHGFGSCQVPN